MGARNFEVSSVASHPVLSLQLWGAVSHGPIVRCPSSQASPTHPSPRASGGHSLAPPSLSHPAPSHSQPHLTLSLSNSGLFDSLNARDISVKIFEDFAQSWYWILV